MINFKKYLEMMGSVGSIVSPKDCSSKNFQVQGAYCKSRKKMHKMKFNDWLELREAGFFSGLFGKKTPPVQQPQIKQSEEDKERERQRKAWDDSMALLVPGYRPREEHRRSFA